MAHLVLDAQPDVDGESILASLASPDLDPGVRRYLIEDLDGQRQLGTKRLLDPTLETWIRSSATGPASEPATLQVEVMGNLISEPLDIHTWYGTRYDLAWQDGRWQLVAFYDARPGPDTAANMTPAERKEFLTGPGWRRIPPAD